MDGRSLKKKTSVEIHKKHSGKTTVETHEKPSGCCGGGRREQKVTDADSEVGEKCCSKNKHRKSCTLCCKKFLAFLFSHIGLCSLVVAYSILGGFIFMRLEAPYEKTARKAVTNLRTIYVTALWNLTRGYNMLYPQNWTIEAEEILTEFQTMIYQATKEKGWDGKEGDADSQWSFAGALLYSITVITTIGYGHIAPKTDNGRLVTMIYATIGIPLTLLCLANLGNFFGNCFRVIYKYTTTCILCLCCPPSARANKRHYTKREIHMLEEGKPLNTDSINGLDSPKISPKKVKVTLEGSNIDVDRKERVRVPIFVSLMIISLYIFGGAVLFSNWEGWSYLIGSYFCFITLSTIGFGDFVPGADTHSFANQQKLIICSFYLIFGLSLIAMCFNLMQEEVRAKFRWLGKKLGIIASHK